MSDRGAAGLAALEFKRFSPDDQLSVTVRFSFPATERKGRDRERTIAKRERAGE